MASHRCTYIKAIHGFQAVDTAAQDRLASTALRTVGPNDKKTRQKLDLFIVQKLYDHTCASNILTNFRSKAYAIPGKGNGCKSAEIWFKRARKVRKRK